MSGKTASGVLTKPAQSIAPAPSTLLQRKCVCGSNAGVSGGCSACAAKKLTGDKPPLLQPKLRISQPNDKYEKEADRVADMVMRMPEPKIQREMNPQEDEDEETLQTKSIANSITPLVQRQAGNQEENDEETIQAKLIQNSITPLVQRQAETEEEDEEQVQLKPRNSNSTIQRQEMGEEEDEEETIQTKRDSKHTPTVTQEMQSQIEGIRKSGGRPLSKETRAFMEPRFGHDFSQVRVHTGIQATSTAQRVRAKAFTMGKDIVFANNAFDQNGSHGRSLLAHELTHYIQQKGRIVGNKHKISRHSPISQGVSPIQRKLCDPLVQHCPKGTACLPTESNFKCLPTDLGEFKNIVKKILKTRGTKLNPRDEESLEQFVNRAPYPTRLKELEKEIVLWPAWGDIRKKAKIIEIVTAPVRETNLIESQRGRFSEEEGAEVKAGLDKAVIDEIEKEKIKLLKENKDKPPERRIPEERIPQAAINEQLGSCLDFLHNASLDELFADEEQETKVAKDKYLEGIEERKKEFPGIENPPYSETLSRLASELRLQGLVGPIHLLKWKGSHENGHHVPEPADLFNQLSSAGDGWYFFLVSLFSFHTFSVGVHVSSGGTKRRYFEIQGGQSVEKTREEVEFWFDRRFDPKSSEKSQHTRAVGSRVWQVYLVPID